MQLRSFSDYSLGGEKKQFVFDRKTNLISWRQKKEATRKEKKNRTKRKKKQKKLEQNIQQSIDYSKIGQVLLHLSHILWLHRKTFNLFFVVYFLINNFYSNFLFLKNLNLKEEIKNFSFVPSNILIYKNCIIWIFERKKKKKTLISLNFFQYFSYENERIFCNNRSLI